MRTRASIPQSQLTGNSNQRRGSMTCRANAAVLLRSFLVEQVAQQRGTWACAAQRGGFVRMSSPSRYGVNSLRIGDSEYLLAVGGGWAIHLVPEAADAEDRRPAVPAEDLDPRTPGFNPDAAGYDRDALTALRWRPTTLCGRAWGIMAAGELGPIHHWASPDMSPDLAPTCRTCLRSIDRFFPPPAMDDRVRLLAHLAADAPRRRTRPSPKRLASRGSERRLYRFPTRSSAAPRPSNR